MRNYYYIFVFIVASLVSSCRLDQWNLDKKEIINFEKLYTEIKVVPQQKAGLFQLDNGHLLTALSDGSDVSIYEFNEKGEIEFNKKIAAGIEASDFISVKKRYYLLYNQDNKSHIAAINKDYSIYKFQEELKTFIDTAYNQISAFAAHDIQYDKSTGKLLICGSLLSFGRQYAFVMGLNLDLKPLWINLYFKSATAYEIKPFYDDRFVVLGARGNEIYLISDNKDQDSLQIRTIDEFTGYESKVRLATINNKLYISGTLGHNNTRIFRYLYDINKDFDYEYYISGSSKCPIVASFEGDIIAVTADPYNSVINISNNSNGITTMWCNQYSSTRYEIPLSIIKSNKIGYYILSLGSKDGEIYHPRIIKIDDEGATRLSPYNENCN